MKFRPLHDRVVVERVESEQKTAGGIIIPDGSRKADAGQGDRHWCGRPRRDWQGSATRRQIRRYSAIW